MTLGSEGVDGVGGERGAVGVGVDALTGPRAGHELQGYVRRIRTLMVRYAAHRLQPAGPLPPEPGGSSSPSRPPSLGSPTCGRTGPLYDCSGLVQGAYAAGREDLVFMGSSAQLGTATHVGDLMVDDAYHGAVVRIEPYNSPDLTGLGRIT